MEIFFMDEFNANFTVYELISKEMIHIKTVHLLYENEKFIIAVNWIDDNETHFKMFKNQDDTQLKAFCDFLLGYDENWYNLAENWTKKPLIPIRLHN